MWLFVAASRPTGALLQETAVIDVPDQNLSRLSLLLKVAFQAKRGVALVEQSLVNGAVRRMADDTTLPQCFMLINPRPALRGVTLETGLVLT